MAYLNLQESWAIIKASGDNGSESYPIYDEQPADIHMFVVNNRCYGSHAEAAKICRELAAKSPGNRYYVVEFISGYMAPVTTIQEGLCDQE